MEFFSLLQEEWVIRALIASSVVGLMCGVLGSFVVLRNMAMIGDALSHSILPGVVFAFMLVGHSTLGFFTGSVIAGLLTAIGITWIQQQGFTKNDAAIGIVFTAMFSIGVMAISAINRRPGVHLDLVDFLFGDVLGVSNEDLWLTGGVAVYVVLSILFFYRYLFVTTFQPVIARTMGISVQLVHYFVMLLLSFVVVAALRTVGVILVVAMLITPAATALLLADRLPRVLVISGVLGVLSAFLGLVLSIEFDTTPGPAMAIVAAGFYLLALFFAPRRGLLTRYRQRRQVKRRILLEDTLKEAYRLSQNGRLTLSALSEKLGISQRRLQPFLLSLRRRKWLSPDQLALTDLGEDEARKFVRAHRLWESYLVSHVGLSAEQIHEEAEHYEHFLDEDLLDEVAAELNYPRTDPHGSPIPHKKGHPEWSLAHLETGQVALIEEVQDDDHVVAELWQMELLPGSQITMGIKQKKQLQFDDDQGHTYTISRRLAEKIHVQLAKEAETGSE